MNGAKNNQICVSTITAPTASLHQCHFHHLQKTPQSLASSLPGSLAPSLPLAPSLTLARLSLAPSLARSLPSSITTPLASFIVFLEAALAADAASKLNILGHDGDPLGVDGTHVGVLEQSDKVVLGCLLEGEDSATLVAEFAIEIL